MPRRNLAEVIGTHQSARRIVTVSLRHHAAEHRKLAVKCHRAYTTEPMRSACEILAKAHEDVADIFESLLRECDENPAAADAFVEIQPDAFGFDTVRQAWNRNCGALPLAPPLTRPAQNDLMRLLEATERRDPAWWEALAKRAAGCSFLSRIRGGAPSLEWFLEDDRRINRLLTGRYDNYKPDTKPADVVRSTVPRGLSDETLWIQEQARRARSEDE